MLNTLVHNMSIHKGFQWALHNASVQHDPLRTHEYRLPIYKGAQHNPCEDIVVNYHTDQF